MNDTGNPPAGGIASAPFLHLEEMIRAYAGATTEADRRLFLRGILRALEYVAGKTHAVLVALVAAVAKEGR